MSVYREQARSYNTTRRGPSKRLKNQFGQDHFPGVRLDAGQVFFLGLFERAANHGPDLGLDAGHACRRLPVFGQAAHRAKGLEFDHVVVLDGGWDRTDRNEDPDAPRRLYYVAMTRARQTLCLARLDGQRHPLLDGLPASPALLHRSESYLPPADLALGRRYVLPNLGEVDLGYAGR